MIDLTQEDIMKNWGVDNSDNPLVSIKCMTFNHENYITQCIDGFLMQKTNFPFEILIHDDCSTDKTESIVRDYEAKFPKIIKGIYETENQWKKGCGAHHTKIDAAIKGKYIAICEGDDYWIDENKLQMQVDFLENNPEYGMCYTKAKPYNQDEQKFHKKTIGSSFHDFKDLLVNGNRVPTLTTVYRKDLLDKYQQEIQPSNKGWLMGDYPMWLYFSHECKVKFFDIVTAVYRVLENSASHSVDVEKVIKFKICFRDIQHFFCERYGISASLLLNEEIKISQYFNYALYRNVKCYLKNINELKMKYKFIVFISYIPVIRFVLSYIKNKKYW